MEQLRTYDFKDFVTTFGTIIMSGEAEEGYSFTSPDDAFIFKYGADGSEERTNTAKSSIDVTLNLLATNPKNDELSALHISDKLTNKGAMPWLTKDLEGTTSVEALYATIKKAPDLNIANEGDMVSWSIRLSNVIQFTGGKDGVSNPFG